MTDSLENPTHRRGPAHPFDWRVLRSHYALRDRWIAVRADTCQMPTGQVLDPFYVLEYPDYINVVAITPQREVVLVREYRHGLGQIILNLPSGSVDPGDPSARDTAQRELLEETGFAPPGGLADFIPLCVLSPNPANHANRVHSFLALNVTRIAEPQPEASEQLEIMLLPLPQVITMLHAGEFAQAMHAAALFYALRQLEGN